MSKFTYFYPDDLDTIQSIRFFQSLQEKKISLSIEPNNKEKVEYLNNFFHVPYKIKKENDLAINKFMLDHKEKPCLSAFNIKLPLVFPIEQICFLYSKWSRLTKNDNLLFIGLMTDKRQKFLNKIKSNKITIYSSDRGRIFPIKCWDNEYYEKMTEHKFCICPDGDFIWTYRFFESIMCGCIPIVENKCSLYKGFEYFTIKDINKLQYSGSVAERNLTRLINRFTLWGKDIETN